jgi:PHD/YefM family antitoxin component YafN of YafNO toxin-antitoxin module
VIDNVDALLWTEVDRNRSLPIVESETSMLKQEPTTQTMKLSDVEACLSSLVEAISRQQTRILIETDGVPVAALISIEDLQQLVILDEERAERWQILEAMRAPFRGVPTEEIEREAAKAIAEVRAERRATREKAAKSA